MLLAGPLAPQPLRAPCWPAAPLRFCSRPFCLPALPLARPRCLLGLPHSSRSQPPPPSRCLPALSNRPELTASPLAGVLVRAFSGPLSAALPSAPSSLGLSPRQPCPLPGSSLLPAAPPPCPLTAPGLARCLWVLCPRRVRSSQACIFALRPSPAPAPCACGWPSCGRALLEGSCLAGLLTTASYPLPPRSTRPAAPLRPLLQPWPLCWDTKLWS